VNPWRILAFVTLALHLAWLVWILLGWLVTRRRVLLRWLHILSLLWGIVISVFPWTCPLTYAEIYFERRAGTNPYEKSFLEHYVELLVYPNVPPRLLMWSAVAVCLLILGTYVRRYMRKADDAW